MLFESQKKNNYFFDRKVKSTQWCHPVLCHLLKLHYRGINVTRWFRELNDETVPIDDYGTASKPEITYYYQKYMLLRDNGFFSLPDTGHPVNGRLNPGHIKASLANTRQLTLEVVDFCNLECAYCVYGKFYNKYHHRGKKKLSIGAAKTVLNYLLDLLNSPLNQSHHQVFYIGFYGGEPLLNFSFIREMAAYVSQLKTLHNRFCFNITTNGILLEKYMDFLVENEFDLLISLDGNEYNNSYRVFKDGTPAYPEILKNINALKTKYPRYFKEKVNFNAVIHNRNSVSDIHHYFKSQFNKVPTISELNPGGIDANMREEFRKTYANINTSLSQVEDYSMVEKDMFINLPNTRSLNSFLRLCSGFVFNDYNELKASVNKTKKDNPPKKSLRIPTGTCVPFSRKVFITAKGKILPCERIGHQYSLGAADEKNVDLDFEKIAGTYNTYFDRLKKQCGSCGNSEGCSQCLFFLDMNKPHPQCSGFLNDDEFSRLLSARISYLEKTPETYLKIMKEVKFA
jgi:uncharacterized protein